MRLTLGTVQFGLPYGIANQTGQVSLAQARSMLTLAADQGIDTLDTAIAYGDSETRLGELGIGKFKTITKLPALPEGVLDVDVWVQNQVTDSMARLGTSRLYGLLLHRSEQLLGSQGHALFQSLQDLKSSGLVRKIGISVYSPHELDAIFSRFQLDLVQAPFNLVDRRMQSSGWLRWLKSAGVEVHTRSAFLQGLLLMSKLEQSARFSAWSETWERWHQWLHDHNVSAVRAALSFPLSFSEVDRVVVGADGVDQLAELIDTAKEAPNFELPDLSCDSEYLINPSCWPKR